jgi:hypothetical protein
MKKIFRWIATIFDVACCFLTSLDFIGLLFVLLIIIIATPVYLISNYTEIKQPFLVSIILVIIVIFVGFIFFAKRKKKNT